MKWIEFGGWDVGSVIKGVNVNDQHKILRDSESELAWNIKFKDWIGASCEWGAKVLKFV